MSSMGYRPEIDGLRAVAVIPVILFHLGFGWIAGGYVGVDVFFVISGFLITSIVTSELEAGTFTLREFWARRIRRILPTLIVVMATSLTVGALVATPNDRVELGKQALAALLSVANVFFWWNTGDYWGDSAARSPFLHTWSLSVEEQFYVFFPVVVWLVIRFRPKWLGRGMLCVAISSLCLFLYGVTTHPTATFYLLPSRTWELATGGFLAILVRKIQPPADQASAEPFRLLALAGLGMIVASYLFLPTLNGGLVVAVLGTAFVIAFARSGACQVILSQRYLVFVGKISYSLYLWHWPVIVFADSLGMGTSRALPFGVICLLSLASYRFIEQPTRKRRGMIPIIAVGYLLTVGFAGQLALTTRQYDLSVFEKPSSPQLYYDLQPRNELGEHFQKVYEHVTTPRREAPADAFLKGGIIVGAGDSPPRVVVLGDSHGVMWSGAIRTVTEKLGVRTAFYSMNGVSPCIQWPLSRQQQAYSLSAEEKYQYDQARLDFIKEWKPQLVIVCKNWTENGGESADDLLTFLEEHASHVLLMEQPPVLEMNSRNVMLQLCDQQVQPEEGVRKYLPLGQPEDCQAAGERVRALAKKYRNCDFIPMFDLYGVGSKVLVLDGKNVVYVDNNHLTTYGAQLGIPRIEQMISSLVKAEAAPSSPAGE